MPKQIYEYRPAGRTDLGHPQNCWTHQSKAKTSQMAQSSIVDDNDDDSNMGTGKLHVT
jgi:hypothetical protein